MTETYYRTAIETEQDECGWHALVIDAEDDSCIYVTDSYPTLADALDAARDWLDRRQNQTPLAS